jgi:hypothetical protein
VSNAIASGRSVDESAGGYVLCECRYAVDGLKLERRVEPDMWVDGRRETLDPEKVGAPTAEYRPEKLIWPLDLSGGGPGKRSGSLRSSSSGSNTVYGFEDKRPRGGSSKSSS